MKHSIFYVLLIVALGFIPAAAKEGEHPTTETAVEQSELKAQETCPVMKAPIHKALYVDHEGERVYFCCGMCKSKFLEDPEKYKKILEELGEKPERIDHGDDDYLYKG